MMMMMMMFPWVKRRQKNRKFMELWLVTSITLHVHTVDQYNTGWWLGHPSEKYESQLGWLETQYMGE